MTAPFSAVLTTPDGPQVITSLVSGLTFKSVSPGGYASVECDLPRSLDASVFPPDTEITIYLSTTGEQVGGGDLLESGRNDDGTWHVSFLGRGIAQLQHVDEPYMVIDSSPAVVTQKEFVGYKLKQVGKTKRKRKKPKNGTTAWAGQKPFKEMTGISFAKAEHGSSPDGTDVEGLLFAIPQGTTVATGAELRAEIRTPYLCGQLMGAYYFSHKSGRSTSDWRVISRCYNTGTGGFVTDRNDNFSTTWAGGDWRSTDDFGTTRDQLVVQAYAQVGSTVVANTWAHLRNLIIRARLFDRDGTYRSGSWHEANSVTAAPVFIDILTRRCPDLAIRNVATGTFGFRQLAWYEGITAKEVLDEICEADGTLLYHAWGKNSSGKTIIDLDVAPTTVRYELSTKYGFNAPAPTSEYYNKVVVVGKVNGKDERFVLDRSNGATVRSYTLPLDGDFGGGNAEAAAATFLDANQAPPNAGTITVVGHVLDLETGRWIHHSQILPGQLCRVRGVQPLPDTLNPEAKQDGVTIFRIVSNSVNADAGSATLELDTPVLDTDRAIADLIGA